MNEEENEIIQSLWHHTELARPSYSDVRPIVSTLSPRMRVYTLPNSEMQVVANPLDDGGARIQLHLASGAPVGVLLDLFTHRICVWSYFLYDLFNRGVDFPFVYPHDCCS
jgi:hypothetical protein